MAVPWVWRAGLLVSLLITAAGLLSILDGHGWVALLAWPTALVVSFTSWKVAR
jgi:hypothetical protein